MWAESGTCALAAGDWDGARDRLAKAAELSKEYEDAALLSPKNAGEILTEWTINESMSRYKGEGYERVMLHACLAMTYLAKGDLTGAQVEVRRANALLEGEENLYEKSYKAGGFGHMLSAIAYELDRKPADAYIDYARMIEKGVGEQIAGRALVRLSGVLGREPEREQWEARFGPDEERPADCASVVVVAGVGIGPYKREITLPIPTSDGLLQWSIPEFQPRPQPVSGVLLDVTGGDRRIRSVVVEEVGAVAQENLNDRMLWLAGRSAVRAMLKYQLQKQLEDSSDIGFLAAILFTAVTERADLRAWSTLPDTWQAARVFLPPGTHELSLAADGGESVCLGSFEMVAGETMFVFARTIETRLFAHTVGGRRVEQDNAPVAAPAAAPDAGNDVQGTSHP
jgi:hypothetical protein